MTGRYGYDSSSDDSEDDYYSGGIPKGIYINMELFSGNEDSDNYDNSDKSDNSDNVSASQSPTFKTRYDRHLQSHRFLEDHSRRHDTEHDQLDAPQNNTTGAPQNNTTGAPQNNTTDAPQNNTTNVCGEPFEVLDITEDTEIQGSAASVWNDSKGPGQHERHIRQQQKKASHKPFSSSCITSATTSCKVASISTVKVITFT
ncbi:hypothetical protein BGZ58_001407 [Dissophora ornata]|nr:hypothetical protein BGZ58_001407 [Dissophora ornata]